MTNKSEIDDKDLFYNRQSYLHIHMPTWNAAAAILGLQTHAPRHALILRHPLPNSADLRLGASISIPATEHAILHYDVTIQIIDQQLVHVTGATPPTAKTA